MTKKTPKRMKFKTIDGRKTMVANGHGVEPNHGRASLYNQGCRCLECVEANRYLRGVVQQGKRLAKTRANMLPETVKHGKASTYGNWGCRCEPCTDAWSKHCSSYYHKSLSKDARNKRARAAYTMGYVDGTMGVKSMPSKAEED